MRLAPEVSAPSSDVCIWLAMCSFRSQVPGVREDRVSTAPDTRNLSLLLRLLNNLDDAPALVRGERASLDDANLVADCRALLVVRHELRRAADIAAILRVLDESVNAHHASLLHLVRRHDAYLLRASPALARLRACGVPGLRVNARRLRLREGLPRLGRTGRVLVGA